MRKTSIVLIIFALVVVIISLPARAPSRSSDRPLMPPVPANITGSVQYNGFNLNACDGNSVECLDLIATCGDYTYSRISIGISQISGKSEYSAEIPGDDLETTEKDGCSTDELISFTIKSEIPEQDPIYWQSGMQETNHNLGVGSPKMVFLPLIQR